jgi:hypothetical protein
MLPNVLRNVWLRVISDMGRAKKFYESMLVAKLDKLPDPGPGVSEMLPSRRRKKVRARPARSSDMQDGPGPGAVSSFILRARTALLKQMCSRGSQAIHVPSPI